LKPVRVRPAAEADIEDAFQWYENQRAGLGLAFLAGLRAVFEQIAQQPRAHAMIHRDVRRALLVKFPYGVFYREYPEAIVVVAVMHARRAPARWQSRK